MFILHVLTSFRFPLFFFFLRVGPHHFLKSPLTYIEESAGGGCVRWLPYVPSEILPLRCGPFDFFSVLVTLFFFLLYLYIFLMTCWWPLYRVSCFEKMIFCFPGEEASSLTPHTVLVFSTLTVSFFYVGLIVVRVVATSVFWGACTLLRFERVYCFEGDVWRSVLLRVAYTCNRCCCCCCCGCCLLYSSRDTSRWILMRCKVLPLLFMSIEC